MLSSPKGKTTACSVMLLHPTTAAQFEHLTVIVRPTRLTALTQKLPKPASYWVPKSQPNLRQKTTVPSGTFPFAAGAANAFAQEALAKNTAEGRTDETSACSRYNTFTSTRPAALSRETPSGQGPRLASRSL